MFAAHPSRPSPARRHLRVAGDSRVGWAKPTGRANARPMINSACPPFRMQSGRDGGHGARAPLPTLQIRRYFLLPLGDIDVIAARHAGIELARPADLLLRVLDHL